MQVFLQFYVLFAISCVLLLSPLKVILADNFVKTVLLLIAYSGFVRIMAAVYPDLPPFFSMSVFLAHLLFTPGVYLYVRNQVYARSMERTDRVHLLPFLIFCIASGIAVLTDRNSALGFNSNWILEDGFIEKSATLMYTFLFGLTALYFGLLLKVVKHRTMILTSGHSFEQAVTSLGSFVEEYQSSDIKADKQQTGSSHNHSLLSDEKIQQIDEIVTKILETKKPFLQQRYSLKDLSEDTQIPLHQLSAFINKHCGKNFNDFINEFRVHYCKEKILNNECRNKKLEAVAEESGFNNRNTFAIAFKKVTGVNPSQFLKKVKSGTEDYSEVFQKEESAA